MSKRKRFWFNNNLKVGLVLGGGGTRGFSHIGVIKAFEEHGIEFDYVAGTSAGAIVGAMYSAGLKHNEMLEKTNSFTIKDLKTSVIPLMPNKTDNFEELFKEVIGDVEFSELQKEFCAVAVDIKTGEEIHLKEGSVVKSVAASIAVPGIFMPVEIGNYRLFDGGLLNNIPSKVAKDAGCDIIITVDVNSARGGGTDSEKYLDMIFSSVSIMMKSNSLKGYLYSDLIIKPDTRRFKSTKLTNKYEMVEEGYKAAISKMPEIKQLLRIKDKSEGFFARRASKKKSLKIMQDGEMDIEVDIDESLEKVDLDSENNKVKEEIVVKDETKQKSNEKFEEQINQSNISIENNKANKTNKHSFFSKLIRKNKNKKPELNIEEYEFLD